MSATTKTLLALIIAWIIFVGVTTLHIGTRVLHPLNKANSTIERILEIDKK